MGNLINAEEEIRKNSRSEQYPGYVPGSYTLCYIEGGKTTAVARGVCAFELAEDGVYYSNGSYVLKIDKEGKSEKICRADGVSHILAD